VVQKLINAQEPWKGTHIVVKTKQDATTATIKQKAKVLELEVIESDDWDDANCGILFGLHNNVGALPRFLGIDNTESSLEFGEETLVGRTPTPTTTTPEQATVEGLTSTRQEMDNKVAEAPSSGTTNPDA
ncbi:hypothetical protein Prudu_019238, partial [Prunus dulcis]